MIFRWSFVAILLCAAGAAVAAPPDYLRVDRSNAILIDSETARKLWHDATTAQIRKLYPVGKWGFASEVSGGFDDAKTCVVSARAMVLPRSGKSLLLNPKSTADAFGAAPGASLEQCQQLARAKLQEAIQAVTSALIAE